MIEENVVSQAGTTFRMGVADMQRLIKDLGYEPRQRDNWYRLVGTRTFTNTEGDTIAKSE